MHNEKKIYKNSFLKSFLSSLIVILLFSVVFSSALPNLDLNVSNAFSPNSWITNYTTKLYYNNTQLNSSYENYLYLASDGTTITDNSYLYNLNSSDYASFVCTQDGAGVCNGGYSEKIFTNTRNITGTIFSWNQQSTGNGAHNTGLIRLEAYDGTNWHIMEGFPNNPCSTNSGSGVINCKARINLTQNVTRLRTKFYGSYTGSGNPTWTIYGTDLRPLNIIDLPFENQIYFLNVSSPDFVTNNLTFMVNSSNVTYSVPLYYSSSVNITFKDITTLNIINSNVNVQFVSENFGYTFTAVNGSLNQVIARPDSYLILASNSNYATTYYNVNVTNQTSLQFTMYLLNTSLDTTIQINVKNARNVGIQNAIVIISFGTSNGFETFNVKTTDLDGGVAFNLQEGYTYKICIMANGYNPRCSLYEFFSVNNPYNIQLLSNTTTSIYQDVFNDVTFAYSPQNTNLPNGSNTFQLSAYSASSTLEYISLTTSNGTTNSSSSPTAINIQRTENVTNIGNYPVNYCIKATGYNAYCFNVTYALSGYSTTSVNGSFLQSAEDFKNELDNSSSDGKIWYTLLALLAILAVSATLYQLTMNEEVATISSFLGLIFFGYIGWISSLYVGAVILIIAIIYFYNRNGA